MKIKDMNIKDLDRKWFLIENPRELNRINKLFKFRRSKYPVVGYSYIDHEDGLSMRILGNVKFEDKVLMLDKKLIDERIDIIRLSEIKKLDIREIESDILRKIKYIDDVEEEMDKYYDNPSIIALRKENILDNFRDPFNPDDIQFLVISREYPNGEIIWGKLEDKEEDKYIAKVIVEPNQDYGIKLDDMVELKYVEREAYTGLVFIKKHF